MSKQYQKQKEKWRMKGREEVIKEIIEQLRRMLSRYKHLQLQPLVTELQGLQKYWELQLKVEEGE